jgi:hypothetical protein
MSPHKVSRRAQNEGRKGATAVVNFDESPRSFVVVFFHTRGDELRCRVTDVNTRESWIVRGAPGLWQLLLAEHNAAKEAPGTSS